MKKAFIIGLLVGSIGFASISSAGNFVENITVHTKPITLKENGEEIKIDNINKNGMYYNGKAWVPSTMIYEGTTYVPIRVVAESFRKEVVWDGEDGSISFNDYVGTPPAPKTKKIPVLVEGMTDMRDSTLKSSNLGYDMYVLNNFTLTAEEPFKDVLMSNYDNSFFVRIELLDKNTNITDYRNQLKDSLEGKVHDLNPDQIFDEFFHSADFYLLQETKNGDLPVSVIHLVRDYGSQKFRFMLHMPSKEAAEGIGPSFWAMLKTIEVK
ncbi:copper amine oxidase N-terminal domain-containing protein [Bacillus sp. Marseille-P3661]|uniref:copper amine oxidase N-terminal domain-containing protein n=1 Tax=Bacillus sp. Marseille-P3661 TaxID=1936234 RepID=UPI0011579CDA|nr:copper amine oxidase N-terminal domain-containing protein [Bacillus sp. Marseille-P3661]